MSPHIAFLMLTTARTFQIWGSSTTQGNRPWAVVLRGDSTPSLASSPASARLQTRLSTPHRLRCIIPAQSLPAQQTPEPLGRPRMHLSKPLITPQHMLRTPTPSQRTQHISAALSPKLSLWQMEQSVWRTRGAALQRFVVCLLARVRGGPVGRGWQLGEAGVLGRGAVLAEGGVLWQVHLSQDATPL